MTSQKKAAPVEPLQPEIVPIPQPESGPSPDDEAPTPSVAVPPTGRTITNLQRARRTIT